MKIIDKAKAHFDSLEIKEIEVPEWSSQGEVIKIYAKPLTLAEMSKLQRYAKDDDVALTQLKQSAKKVSDKKDNSKKVLKVVKTFLDYFDKNKLYAELHSV